MNKLMKSIILILIVCVSFGCSNNRMTKEEEEKFYALLEKFEKEQKNGIDFDSTAINYPLMDWKVFKSEKGNFQIEFPDFEIKETTTTQLLDGEEKVFHRYSINTQNEEHENLGYGIVYSFWPNIKTEKQIQHQFNLQKEYLLSVSNSKLEYELIIDSLNYPGRELYFTLDRSEIKIKYRIKTVFPIYVF